MALRYGSPVLVFAVFLTAWIALAQSQKQDVALPVFGRDTVLVWKILNQDDTSEFVVRVAEFLPDRYVEWENATTQGTIFMPNRAILAAKIFVSASLFEAGVDTRGKDKTTLWLSRQIYHDIKDKKHLKISLDGIDSWLTLVGTDEMSIDVNRVAMSLPVIKVKDDRGSERAFLDFEENPLMTRHSIRAFTQTLASITTDKSNTLRWIKGKKLVNPH